MEIVWASCKKLHKNYKKLHLADSDMRKVSVELYVPTCRASNAQTFPFTDNMPPKEVVD